ncbi:hypothetical protein N483_21315 [Pseudoalteromonas luteoviolacea NCIMB 1944]|nr:hypothetical protein N483_21315 [Pseudoalteromonas luteoviolacea NCIMB 1944]
MTILGHNKQIANNNQTPNPYTAFLLLFIAYKWLLVAIKGKVTSFKPWLYSWSS